MLPKDKAKLRNYRYLIFRCIEPKKEYAYGVAEGRPGIFMHCNNIPVKRKEIRENEPIFFCPQNWTFKPFDGTFKEGCRYVVERGSLKHLKHELFIRSHVIYEIEEQPFTLIPYVERFADDTIEDVAATFELSDQEKNLLTIYQKAFGFSYRIYNYEFALQTSRSGWRYNVLKKALYHEGHLAENKTGISKGSYMQGWHRQKTGYLGSLIDAILFIADHDYGYTSELQSSATKNAAVSEKHMKELPKI